MIVQELQKIIPSDRCLLGEALSSRYNHIWKMDQGLKAKVFLMPINTAEVSQILSLCNAHDQKVIVFGGLTNLVGSTETNGDEVVISTEKLNLIEEVDVSSRTVTVGAGTILQNIHEAVEEHDLLFPLNFGAKGSAQIGGVISTNAGGLRVFRFGMTRNLVLGLEVVLMDGTVLSSLKKIIKDNSAYDLKQLFIGSEGTLGVITKAVLKLVELPKSRNSAFVGIDKYENVVKFLKHVDKNLAGALSGYELIWQRTYKAMTSPPALSKPPLDQSYNYYVLIESLGANQEDDRLKMEKALESALDQDIIQDAVLAFTESDLNWFWTIREDVHAFVSLCKYDQHFDISLPIALIGDQVDQMTIALENLEGVTHVFPFGHVADGNVHFVVGKVDDSKALTQSINDIIYAPLKSIGGSVSAEHGIGLHKKSYLPLCRSEAEITTMKLLKLSFDPKGLLNSGKVLDI